MTYSQIYSHDFSSDSDWTQNGTLVTINSGVAKFNQASNGTHRSLVNNTSNFSATLNNTWRLRIQFAWYPSTSSPEHCIIALDEQHTNMTTTTATRIGIIFQGTDVKIGYQDSGTWFTLSSGITLSASTTYYLQLEKTSTQLELRNYGSDSTYSGSYTNVTQSYTNNPTFDHIQISTKSTGSGSLDAEMDLLTVENYTSSGGGSGGGSGSEGDAPSGDGIPQTERLQILSTVVPR
tara:strand:+ start:67 stop:771 length:705 start_codon:yes stop_codon:yes gene_type:complete